MDTPKRGTQCADGSETCPENQPERRRLAPRGYDDYIVGWISALPLEQAAAKAMLDCVHETLPQDPADTNTYVLGAIGRYNIAIACLPEYGLANAATVANNMARTFPCLQIRLMVGIGGGVPGTPDIRLGDVVVGTKVVQYDLGKATQGGHFQRTQSSDQPPPHLGTAIAALQGRHEAERSRIPMFLEHFQRHPSLSQYTYPGAHQDTLYHSTYYHDESNPTCDQCDPSQQVGRIPRPTSDPYIYYGTIASANQVIKDGVKRDQLATELGAICFEMEAAGFINQFPCLIIRGISDYSDAHKNKQWQRYAAATAAAYAKELLSTLPPPPISTRAEHVAATSSHFLVPLGRRDDFVGRERLLEQLLNIIPPAAYPHDCQRTAVEGLGGIGKTRLVLEAAYRLHEKDPTISVFWVPAVNVTMLENAYREIGERLGIDGINEDNADVKSLVKAALSQGSAGSWLFILDNADDPELLFEHLMDDLPSSPSGSLLVTTRNHEVVSHLDISPKAVFTLEALTPTEGDEFLRNGLAERQCRDSQSITRLLEFLTYLPLAIKQASAYMYQRGMTVTKYLQYCDQSNKQFVQLLSKDFEDRTRYRDLQNPVATTWLISFEHIMRTQPEAADLLKFICFLGEKNIPTSLFHTGPDTLEIDEALGILRGYAFLIDRGEEESFDIHRLVRLAMRNWIEQNQTWSTWVTDSIDRLDSRFPWPEHDNRKLCALYLPHTESVLSLYQVGRDIERASRLLLKTGRAYDLLGHYNDAEKLHLAAMETHKTKLGADHPDTLSSMADLASTYWNQGRWEKAETLDVEVLEKRKTKLGADHPDTLTSMANLASTYWNQGRWEEAETLEVEVLEAQKTKLGADHPLTLTSMANLASTYWNQGRWEKAETLHVEVLEKRKTKLGADHPSTLTSMANLAHTWKAQGRLTEALDTLSECYRLQCRVIGPDHPHSVDNLRILNRWREL